MNDKIEFKSAEELYNRVKPALSSKVEEFKKCGLKHISEKDIWLFLVENEWSKKKDIELHNMVSDILYVNKDALCDYVAEKLNKYNVTNY